MPAFDNLDKLKLQSIPSMLSISSSILFILSSLKLLSTKSISGDTILNFSFTSLFADTLAKLSGNDASSL